MKQLEQNRSSREISLDILNFELTKKYRELEEERNKRQCKVCDGSGYSKEIVGHECYKCDGEGVL